MGNKYSSIVVLYGPHGCGKSQFLDSVTQTTKWTHHSLRPEEQSSIRQISVWNGTIALIDTPGFDNDNWLAIWDDVKTWRKRNKLKKEDIRVTHMLYLHRITETRLTTRPPVEVFKSLFGDNIRDHITFVTTHWDCVSREVGEAREKAFRAYLIDLVGSPVRMKRSNKTTETAREILRQLLSLQ